MQAVSRGTLFMKITSVVCSEVLRGTELRTVVYLVRSEWTNYAMTATWLPV
jgi:hypothetical protein